MVSDLVRTQEMRRLARAYHEWGFNILPLDGHKQPAITGAASNGKPFRFTWQQWQSTPQSEDLFKVLLRPSYWKTVEGVGAICGPVSAGLANVDFDSLRKKDPAAPEIPKSVVAAFLAAVGLPADYAWVVPTPSGGWHVWILSSDLVLDGGRLDRPGVDATVDHVELRFTGTYAALPGSKHPSGGIYAWAAAEPTEPPAIVGGDALLAAYDAVTRQEAPAKPQTPHRASAGAVYGEGSPYGLTALAGEVVAVRSAAVGGRNDALNTAAFRCGQLAPHELAESTAEPALLEAALSAGLGEAEALRTIRSGLRAGRAEPRYPARDTGHNGNGAGYRAGFAPDTPSDGPQAGPAAAKEAPTAKEEKPNQATLIYQRAEVALTVFRTKAGEAFAEIHTDGHKETHPLRSQAIRNYLGSLYYLDHGRAPGAQAIEDATRLLEWDARKDKRAVYTRVSAHKDKVYLDMGNEAWQAIEIDGDGWRIVDDPPVVFRRPNGLEPLPVPTRPGNVRRLTEFAHVDPEDWPLLAGWIVAALSGTGPYPILVLNGEQGSAKSTLARVVKELIDPSEAELRSQPEDVRDLMIGAGNAWVLAYDNISRISGDVSDALCRISTGGGYAKRRLYADDQELLINVQRPIVLTGIADFVTRADLMDRAVILSLPAMQGHLRKEERIFWDAFYEARPVLLAGFLDALSEGLRRRDTVQMKRLPRMADFAKLATAAEGALGLAPGEFMARYAQNRNDAVGGLLEGALIVPALSRLVVVAGSWSGTSSELLEALEGDTPEAKRSLRQWPKTARQLSEELKRLAPSLRAAGIVDAEQKRVRGERIWQISRLNNCLQDGSNGDRRVTQGDAG